ncbi:hypothetical protein BDV93DRAFT_506208 [Ceratobasidium sp. AG-I]|nr:hypothetical protein BDV93DRAFT_506208 [Ceratobasidium sp. AG-I]
MCSTIPSNPDIVGLGVRLSFYGQTLFIMLTAAKFPKVLDTAPSRILQGMNVSLILSAVIQYASKQGFSLNDTIVVSMLAFNLVPPQDEYYSLQLHIKHRFDNRQFIPTEEGSRRWILIGSLFTWSIILAAIEQTILRNDQREALNQWSFGQTLALTTTLFSIFQSGSDWKQHWKVIIKTRGFRQKLSIAFSAQRPAREGTNNSSCDGRAAEAAGGDSGEKRDVERGS